MSPADAIALALCPLGLAHRVEDHGPDVVLSECLALIEAAAALAADRGARLAARAPDAALWLLPADAVDEAVLLAADLCALALAARARGGGPLPGLGLARGPVAAGPTGALGLPTLRALALAGPQNRGAELLAAEGADRPWIRPPPGLGASPLRADRCAAIGFPTLLLRDHRAG